MEFDKTESAYIEKKINEQVTMPQIGDVVEVSEHTQADDNSNFEVDVNLRGEDKTRRNVPVASSTGNLIHPPQTGDTVLVQFLDTHMDSEYPVVFGHIYTTKDRAVKGESGMFRLNRGDLYTEVDSQGNWARISKKSGDAKSPTSKVEVDDSGTNTVVNIEAEGDVIINSSGGKVILGGTSGDPVARKGDSVSGSTSDGATFDGTIDSGSSNVDSA